MFCKLNIWLFSSLLNMILRQWVGGSVVGWSVIARFNKTQTEQTFSNVFFELGFASCKVEQLLEGMEPQKKRRRIGCRGYRITFYFIDYNLFHILLLEFEACLWFNETLYIHGTMCLNFGLNSEVSNKKVLAFRR